MEEQITIMKLELFQEVRGAKGEETSWSYSNEPLALEVLAYNLFTSFKISKLSYNDMGDPKDHLAY
ncbi:hypothetical protein PVK06_020996 [Gossypium arboreum]|uniref:Uncharacterized protein n=1 Tax=Gossypium arboreum TaxID=29729 RepID=A0ABR0PNT7_GOSAR|nr:hypothetical protein PVK06_020996 [Gossypium arboreum]